MSEPIGLEKSSMQEIAPILLEWLQKIEKFTAEQTPLLIQEILDYNFYMAAMLVGFFAAFTIVAAVCTIVTAKSFHKSYNNDDWVAVTFIGLIVTGTSLIPLLYNVNAVLKIWLAPRLYMIEYVSSLLK